MMQKHRIITGFVGDISRFFEKIEKSLKKVLTKGEKCDNINELSQDDRDSEYHRYKLLKIK